MIVNLIVQPMLRFLFTGLLVGHGLLHLPGFLSQWPLIPVGQSIGKPTIPLPDGATTLLGLAWLVVGLGFVLAAVGYWLRRDGWMPLTLGCLLVSQCLIVLYWPDARAGTLVNAGIATVLLMTYMQVRFDRKTDQEARQLLGQAASDRTIVTVDRLVGLPKPVQQWLIRSGVVGKEAIHTVRLRQHGLMRTKPDGHWMTAEAEQYVTVDEPGFVWKATIDMAPLLRLTGRDRYTGGHGSMNIRFMSLVSVADAQGPETDQGTLLRFLSEIMWYPGAALSPYICWEPIDDRSARATMHYGDVTASGVFRFSEQGDVTGFETRRYMEKDGHYSLETWTTAGSTYRTLCNGIRIPTQGSATWKLKTGDFTWYKLTIGTIDYNKPVLY